MNDCLAVHQSKESSSWPGIGRMAVAAAFQRDYPVLMALVMMGSVLVILGNLLADIAYGWVDPRVRYD